VTIALPGTGTPQQTSGTRAGLRQAVRAEWTKLATLRSTKWTLAVTVVGTMLVTVLATQHVSHRLSFKDFDPTNQAMTGLAIASLTMGVLGVLTMSGEYGTGTIRSSLAALPRRETLLTAKVAVVGVLTLLVGEVLSFSAFFLGQAVLAAVGAPSADLGQPGVLRAVVLSGAFLSLLALLGLGIGAIVRHTAGALAAYAGVVLLVPILLQTIGGNPGRFAPELIFANSVSAVVPQSQTLSATVGFLLMVAYTLAALGLGAALLTRRDA
jgi:ABC-type transport system involved in multi-copper enzyme maturation permease subunit